MPPISPLLKLAAQYGPSVVQAVKTASNLDPEQRQRLLTMLRAASPKRRLRQRVEALETTLAEQVEPAASDDRAGRLAEWLGSVRAMQKRLDLADGLPSQARSSSYDSVRGELDLLVADLVRFETGGDAPALVRAVRPRRLPRPALPRVRRGQGPAE